MIMVEHLSECSFTNTYGGNMDKETKDYLAYKMAEMRRKTRELKTKKFKRKKDWKIFRAKVNKENTDEQ